MKKSRMSIILFSFFTLAVTNIIGVQAAEPRRLPMVSCNGSFNEYLSRTRGHEEVIWNSGYFLNAGDTIAYTWQKSFSVSNSTSINILPELLSMGYSTSYSVQVGTTVTVHNNTTTKKEVKGYRIYDNVKYMEGNYVGGGACTYTTPTMKVYRGYMLAAK